MSSSSTRDARLGPPISSSQRVGRLLVVIAKREFKEDNDQHEDHE
jgi:hypothetical protein